LLRAGKKIAVCEQVELPQGGKGIAERRVVEVITPGTVVDEDLLDRTRNNYLTAVGRIHNTVSFSGLDLSTGEFLATAFPWESRREYLQRELARLRPSELLIQESLVEQDAVTASVVAEHDELVVNRYPDWSYDLRLSRDRLLRQFQVSNLKGFGIADDEPAIFACGVLLDYVSQTAKSLMPHIRGIRLYGDEEFAWMDESTQRNLEILQSLQEGGKRYSLLEVMDDTKTAMGARALRGWLLAPLRSDRDIARRLDAVERLYRDQRLLSSLRGELSRMLDVERLTARVAMERAHGKDLSALRICLSQVLEVEGLLEEWEGRRWFWTDDESVHQRVVSLEELLRRSVAEDPPVVLTEGKLIRSGYSEDLDALHRLRDDSRSILERYLEEEKARSGIASLKIRYNKIIGYYLEVTKANLHLVPEHFVRRQSLVGSERFTTDRLVELETELNSAYERIVELEKDLFLEVRSRAKERVEDILTIAREVAHLDCIQSFAQVATVRGYTRPATNGDGVFRIVEGRHPVVEAHLAAGDFVPNSLDLGADDGSFALITGPNMAGKSTYLRQVALICLLAQVGSYVPAASANVGIADRIFCRVGAQDNLARGESTFLVEMNETANILRSATPASLVIMDEVGRGTGTNDGLAIAWAVSEFLLRSVRARTLFATHYHELTELELPGIRNLSMAVREHGREIVFLKRVQEGPSSNSYGIHVAKLAGLPEDVVERAEEVLRHILAARSNTELSAPPEPGPRREQSELWSPSEMVEQEIRSLNLENVTPLEALNRIARWQQELAGQ
jgi:DNA mismatch repair protein MutS